MTDRLEMLVKMYDEHASHAKLHEEQREKMTNYLFVASGVIVTFVTTAKFAYYTMPASLVLIVTGIYGALFSLKHYERNRHHTTIMKEFRDDIDFELNPKQGGESRRRLAQIVRDGRNKHEAEFHLGESERERAASTVMGPNGMGLFVLHSRLYRYWAAMPLLLVAIGVIFIFLPLTGIGKAEPEKPVLVKLVEPSVK